MRENDFKRRIQRLCNDKLATREIYFMNNELKTSFKLGVKLFATNLIKGSKIAY